MCLKTFENPGPEAQKSRSGGVSGRLGGVLGRLGGVLGRLGSVLGRLGASWGRLEASKPRAGMEKIEIFKIMLSLQWGLDF